ncbi:chaperonin 10-like protein [Apodospora peruviana]|uniref:Chaperonin 10-like protein n=1 Tax=Apodospora peruviana TaxID=516989 RepID=A0AAE0ISM6_9PEZI|nr:chaperonin 10-like protein [Apodospora peruviana]
MPTTSALPPGVPATHQAVATSGLRAPLQIIDVPTEAPGHGHVLIHVSWTSSSPLELHQADGGLLVQQHPYILGGSFAGTVVSLGPKDPTAPAAPRDRLQPGDQVFGFAFRHDREKGFQTYITTPQRSVSKLPPNLTPQQAVTVSTNLVTAMHTLTTDLGLQLPWPVPGDWSATNKITPTILVWGAASSVGLYALQVLRYWGYNRGVIAVASSRHHEELKRLGAAACADYQTAGVVEKTLGLADDINVDESKQPKIPLILDCIGSRDGSLRPITKIAEPRSKVAIMLPVINTYSSSDKESLPEYEMDVSRVLSGEWKKGVELKGTRTHFYEKNEFFKFHLQPDIIPALLESGAIEPNKQRIIEGTTLLERAQKALDLLRDRAPSGEKLVWRVADDGNIDDTQV